jgi:hypothetical protein
MKRKKCSGAKNLDEEICKSCEDIQGDAIMAYTCYKCRKTYTGCELVRCEKCGKRPTPNFSIAVKG